MNSRSRITQIGCLSLLLLLLTAVSAHNVGRTAIGRYMSVANRPTAAQVNPLLAVSTFHFGLPVHTVGDAITQVLRNTGYALAPKRTLSADILAILGKPLPVTQRTLGPLMIKTTLTVLMGQQVVELIADPVHRLVTFRLNPRIKRALTHGEPHHDHR